MYIEIESRIACGECGSELVEHVTQYRKTFDRCRKCGHEGNHGVPIGRQLTPRKPVDHDEWAGVLAG